MRERISRAAASVNVIAMSWLRRAGLDFLPFEAARLAMKRCVRTNVLPQPAPAESATEVPVHSMALRCSVVSSVTAIRLQISDRGLAELRCTRSFILVFDIGPPGFAEVADLADSAGGVVVAVARAFVVAAGDGEVTVADVRDELAN